MIIQLYMNLVYYLIRTRNRARYCRYRHVDPGKRRVIVHMLNGQTQRGTIRLLKKGDTKFAFEPQGSGARKEIAFQQIKAIFAHLPTNTQPKKPEGKLLTVTFNDRRSIQGYSNDYKTACRHIHFGALKKPEAVRKGHRERKKSDFCPVTPLLTRFLNEAHLQNTDRLRCIHGEASFFKMTHQLLHFSFFESFEKICFLLGEAVIIGYV